MKMKWEKARAEAEKIEKPQTNFNGCSVVLSARPMAIRKASGWQRWWYLRLVHVFDKQPPEVPGFKQIRNTSILLNMTGSTSGPACLCAPSWLDRSVPRALSKIASVNDTKIYSTTLPSKAKVTNRFRQDCRFADGMNHLLTCRWQFKNWSFSRRCVFSFPFWRCDLKFGCWLWLLAHWIDLVLYNLCCKLYSSSIVISYLCIFASLWFVESQISSWRAPSGVAEVLQLRCLPDMEGNKASRQVGKSASRQVETYHGNQMRQMWPLHTVAHRCTLEPSPWSFGASLLTSWQVKFAPVPLCSFMFLWDF